MLISIIGEYRFPIEIDNDFFRLLSITINSYRFLSILFDKLFFSVTLISIDLIPISIDINWWIKYRWRRLISDMDFNRLTTSEVYLFILSISLRADEITPVNSNQSLVIVCTQATSPSGTARSPSPPEYKQLRFVTRKVPWNKLPSYFCTFLAYCLNLP